MPLIAEDPMLEEAPNHAGPEYQEDRATLTAAGLTEEDATQFLRNTWARDVCQWHDVWAARVANKQRAQEELTRQEREAEERPVEEAAAAAEAERREAEKKSVKAGDFDEDRMVQGFNKPKPLPYAMDRLTKKEYVELWYFTREGCQEAKRNKFTSHKDALGLVGEAGEQVQFRSIVSMRASKNAQPDNLLSWDQIDLASKVLLQCMEKTGWPLKHTNTLSKFFIELGFVQAGQPAEFDCAVIEYQYLVCFEWHEALGAAGCFNVSHINMERLSTIHNNLNPNTHQ
ncbi:hypothetical protein BD779DRAFT_1680518 [Infundibulicybe gibba]|nr:hypothetical protein BD779DRAFT_1680518 [Infundibulicybe gibba]